MNEAEELRKKLFNIREDGWVKASQEEKDSIFKYADEYINFLNKGKTDYSKLLKYYKRKLVDYGVMKELRNSYKSEGKYIKVKEVV